MSIKFTDPHRPCADATTSHKFGWIYEKSAPPAAAWLRLVGGFDNIIHPCYIIEFISPSNGGAT
ncbi:TPA: hypothetical protein DF272_02230 [Candidatus Falkowbacteria bacterium]|nr:hypothetical protein [Candidatus Falkowbacteria bacterium]